MTPSLSPDHILPLLAGVRRAGNGWSARCPAHDDEKNSLSITEGEDGKPLLYCFKGCEFVEIVAAIRTLIERHNSDIFDSPKQDEPQQTVGADAPRPSAFVGGLRGGDQQVSTEVPGNPPATSRDSHIVATYDYKDPEGRLLYQVDRYFPKDFLRRYPEGQEKAKSTLYRLPDLSQAPPNRAVFVVEGEKDVESLVALGLIATTSGGAKSWRAEFADLLIGRRVIIIPDNDEAGRAYATAISKSCRGKALSVRIVHLPVPSGGDVSDWLAAGHTKQELYDAIERTREHPPRRWRPMDLSEAKLPPVEGFLNGAIFCRQSLGMIAGRRGVGKTMLLLKLAQAIALGYQFGPYPTRKAKVLLLSQEMTDTEIQDRINKIFTRGERLAINDALTIICRDTFTIDSEKGVEYLASIVEEIRPDIVFIDALFDIKGSAPENDNDEMGAAGRRIIEQVCIAYHCCVVITHHTGRKKDDGSTNPRGATAMEDAAADILFLEHKKDGACVVGSWEPPNGKVRHMGVPKPFGYSISGGEDGRIVFEIIEDLDLAGDKDGLIRRIMDYIDREGASGVETLSSQLAASKAAVKEALKSASALGLLIKAGTGAMTTWSRPVVVN